MSIHRRAARRDSNEVAIVAALTAAGASVTHLSAPGVPDLLVGIGGRTYLLEVKAPLGPRGGKHANSGSLESRGGDGTHTRGQLAWRAGWRGSPAITVRTPAEALAAIGIIVSEASGSPVEDKPGPAHAEGGGHDRAGASRRPATSQSRIGDRDGHALPEPAASTYLAPALIPGAGAATGRPRIRVKPEACRDRTAHAVPPDRDTCACGDPSADFGAKVELRCSACPLEYVGKMGYADGLWAPFHWLDGGPPKPMCPGAGRNGVPVSRDAKPVTTPARAPRHLATSTAPGGATP